MSHDSMNSAMNDDDDVAVENNSDDFFLSARVIRNYGRNAFTESIILEAKSSSSRIASPSISSLTSLTPSERQIARYGFGVAQERLYKTLQSLGIFSELITGGPIFPRAQRIAHMVSPSAKDEFLLLLEFAFGFQPRSFAVHDVWNLALVNQHYHGTITSDGALLLPTMDDLAFIEKHLKEMKEARMYPGDLPDELKWENMLHCGGSMVHQYAYIPFGFSYHHHSDFYPPPPVVQWCSDGKSYVTHPYPYTTMAEVRSHVSPFLVFANAYSKYCVWRIPGNNFRLPPRADIVVVPHTPTAMVASVVYRAASVLSSPQHLARFQRMTEVFSLLDQMGTQRRPIPCWMPPTLAPVSPSPSESSWSSTQYSRTSQNASDDIA